MKCHAELVSASDQLDDESLSFNILKQKNIFKIGKTLKRVQGDRKNGKFGLNAFTLAEVLITLVIIGIIAAVTVPTITNKYKWAQYKSGLLKAQSSLNQAVLKFREEEGYVPRCSYGVVNSDGYYTGTGALSQDCVKLYDYFLKNMNIVKVCNNKARANGCIPAYEGKDTLLAAAYPDKTEDEILALMPGCIGFTQNMIYNSSAFITGDGMIFFPYGGHRQMAFSMNVDVNGFKGPNKWGHDVHSISSIAKNNNDNPVYGTYKNGCSFYEKGGKSPIQLVYGKK